MSKLTNETKAGLRSATRLIHAGRDPEDQYGFVNTPIYRGSTVLFPTMASLKDRHRRQDPELELVTLFKQVEQEREKLCAQYGCP